MSISKWNANAREDHYYVYKNSFLVKDAVKIIGISQPTWRSAIAKLDELHYIKDEGSRYRIRIRQPYAPLQIELIKYLVNYGRGLNTMTLIDEETGELLKNNGQGGNIVAVYSLLWLYWQKCGKDPCEISINQLKTIFKSKRDKATTQIYRLMIGLFQSSGLMAITYITKEGPGGYPNTYYKINYVNTDLPVAIKNKNDGDDNVQEILKKIQLDLSDIDNVIFD